MYQTKLKTTQLGQTGLEITRVGFGAWALGGGDWEHGWGPQDDDVSIAPIDQVDPILAAATLELSENDNYEIEGATR